MVTIILWILGSEIFLEGVPKCCRQDFLNSHRTQIFYIFTVHFKKTKSSSIFLLEIKFIYLYCIDFRFTGTNILSLVMCVCF